MYLYDSSKKEKRVFTPLKEGKVTLYVCGPTVYDNAHLGHAKSALTFDLLVRVLEANGYDVNYTRNITDIDDKIIKKSLETKTPIDQLTSFYTDRFHAEMDALYIKRPTQEPKATKNIFAMIEIIKKLLQDQIAYQVKNGDIYFDISKDTKYLSLSKQYQKDEQKQQRVETNTLKKNNGDFALWKAVQDNSIAFDAPFGKGRPGWHLECSAMIQHHLAYKDTPYLIDIHGGGADLLFPHHENEAAQTRCATHKELAKYWVHNGFVTINDEKMSKSLGNSFFIKDALDNFDGEVIRFYLLSTHYRSNFNFSTHGILTEKKRLDKLYRLKKRVFDVTPTELKTQFQNELLEALNDDLNTSKALAVIDSFIISANEMLDTTKKHKTLKKEIVANINFIQKILGFGVQNPFTYFQYGTDPKIKELIETLIKKREEAKRDKDFALADSIRDEILQHNIQLMDTPNGTFWEKKYD